MSDMNTPEVPAALESAAPEQPVVDFAPALVPVEAPPAAEPAVEAPVSGPEVPAEPEVVQVLQQQPSSASETQAPEAEDVGEDETPVSLEDAARAVVLFVKAHRTVGDADLGAALADLEAALTAQA